MATNQAAYSSFADMMQYDLLTGNFPSVYRKCKRFFNQQNLVSLIITLNDSKQICSFSRNPDGNILISKHDIKFGDSSDQKAGEMVVSFSDPTQQILIQYLFFTVSVLLSTIIIFFFILYRNVNLHIVSPIQRIETLLVRILNLDSDFAITVIANNKILELNHLLNVTKLVGRKLIDFHHNALKKHFIENNYDVARQLAHDIRSPLSALNIATSSLPVGLSEEKALILTAIARLKLLTDTFLRNSKNEYENLGLYTSDSNLNSYLTELSVSTIGRLLDEAILLKEIEAPKVSFKCNFDSNILEDRKVFISATDFSNIISNVFNNSIDACSNTVTCNLKFYNNSLIILIEDDGHGIPKDQLHKVGQKGFSLGKKNGSGLGLSSAKQILVSLGGSIRIESKNTQGCVIILTLPTYEKSI